MNIKIDLVISASPELLEALQLLTSGKTAQVIPPPVVNIVPENGETAKAEIVEVKKTRKLKVPSEPLNASDKEIAAMEKEEAATQEIKTDITEKMIMDDAVPKSKAGHKDKIKAKISELGYESLADMQPVHFEEFYNFLQTIPKPA